MLFHHGLGTVTVRAPAKLNPFLQVLGKRADGFHELETLMLRVSVYDTLRLSPASDNQLRLDCRDLRPRRSDGTRDVPLPSGDDNLILKAARLLRDFTGTTRGAALQLYKRIPLAAGLAGGSSDAAATLAGLNELWQLGLSSQELMTLSARLGSDIPFFFSPSGAAICRGRGEIVQPVQFPQNLSFVIVRPHSGLATAEVFRHCRASSAPWSVDAMVNAMQRWPGRGARYLFNSLQEPAEKLSADITRLKRAFARLPFLGHLMSGSGTSYFGLCATYRQALQLSARLRATQPGDVFVAQSRP